MATPTVIQSTTQKFLDIYDITNDVLILKDGSTALVMTVNAMNFGLLAEPEQDAIMYAYAGLLNSINYSIQIVIRSQTKDVTKYLGLLKEEEDKTVSDVKRNWIRRYREFVGDLIKERNVLDKKFYVVVPASALEMGLLPPSTVLPGVKQPDLTTVERSVILEKAREILEPKRDHLLGQLGRIGLVGRQLTTQEIIQLFYLSYNPEAAEGQQITDTRSYTTSLVEASVQGGTMDNSKTNNPVSPAGGSPAPTGAPATPGDNPSSPAPVAPAMPAQVPNPVAPATPSPAGSPGATPSVNPPSISGTPTPGGAPATLGTNPTSATPAAPVAPATPAQAPSPVAPATPSPMGGPGATPTGDSKPPVPGSEESAAQDAINSTLQQLGGVGGSTGGVKPVAQTPVGGSAPASDDKKPGDDKAMPPLPEI